MVDKTPLLEATAPALGGGSEAADAGVLAAPASGDDGGGVGGPLAHFADSEADLLAASAAAAPTMPRLRRLSREPWWQKAVDALVVLRALTWLFWGGFGAPWVLFAMIGAIALYFFSQDGEPPRLVTSDAYFWLRVLGSVGVALLRFFIIVKIAYDREAERRRADTAAVRAQPISHRNYWWCNRLGLAVSCLFMLGDGMGHVFAPAAALSYLSAAYWASDGDGWMQTGWYFFIVFIASFLSGLYRLVWWMWYWFTFSEISEDARAQAADAAASARDEMVSPSAVVHLDDHGEEEEEEGDSGGRDVELQALSADAPAPKKEATVRRTLRQIYPSISRRLSAKGRYVVKRVYAFLGGFGCSWAIFSLLNDISAHLRDRSPLELSNAYLWTALSLSIVGGIYGGLYGGDRRFKVFLH